MSLRVWLPLNGNLNNQGASNCNTVQTTAPTYVNGKIGDKAMSTGAFYLPAAEVAKFYNNTAMSWCFWIYPTGTGSAATPIIGQSNMSAGDNRMFSIYQYPNAVDLHLSWQSNESNTTFLGTVLSNVLTANTWNHCAITYNGSIAKIYVNNILVGSSNGTSTRTNFSYNVPIPTTSLRYLNDLRIYDHCLSEKEIKEISKALICHYSLDGSGKGGDNIVPNTFIEERSYTYPSSGNSDKWAATTSIIPSASQYVLSFYAKSTVNGDKARAHWYSPNTTTRCESSQGVITTASDGNIDITLSTEWKKYWVIYTQSETTAVKHLIFPRLVSGNGTGTVSVKQIKLEEGTIPTPWCPNSADSEYTTLGYNSTTEIDTSGYKNNGTKSGTLSSSIDSPKYEVSTVFGDNGLIASPAGKVLSTSGNFTVAGWFYRTSAGSTYYASRDTYTTSVCLESARYFVYGTNGSAYVGNWTSVSDTWQHVVLVHDVSISKLSLYVNGSYVSQISTSGNVYLNNTLDIGGRQGTNQYKGNISDFRIYATALSADDIKELYQSSASITNNGSILAYDFTEQ